MSLFRIPAAVLLRRSTLNRTITTQSLRIVQQPASPSTSVAQLKNADIKSLAGRLILFKNYRRPYSTEATGESAASSEQQPNVTNWRQKLDELKSTNALDEASLTEVFAHCRKAHDFETALHALQLARDAGIELTADIYSSVIAAGINEVRFGAIRELFGEPIQEVNHAPKGPGKNYDQIKALLEEMKSRQLELPMWFHEQLVGRMSYLGQAGIVVNLVVALEKRGIVPSITLYNKALHLLPRKGMTDRGENLFNKLIMKGLANYQTYTTWMSSLVLMERYNEVEQTFRSMSKLFKPDIVAYNILINSRLKGENFSGALEIFDSLRQRQVEGVFPDQYTVSTFLDYMLVSGNVQHSQRLFPHLGEVGFPSSSQNYGLLLRFFARYDEAQFGPMLRKILAEKPELQDIFFYNSLLRILTDNQVLSEVKKELGICVSDKLDMAQTSPLLDTLSNAPLATRAIVFLMERNNIKMDEFTFECLMRQMLNRKEYATVERIYSNAMEHATGFSYTMRNMRLTALLMSKDAIIVDQVLEEMRTQRIPVYPRNVALCKDMGVSLPDGVFSPSGRPVRGGNEKPHKSIEYI